ncbi:MAG: winged helix DNA-binding domain-containing protein [Gordonia sp. (in: high G+C Gram-positive bacteria)]
MSGRVSAAQWNRTLLARQYLLERADEDAIEVIDRLVGLHSQNPSNAFFALWSRIEGFTPGELDDLLIGREVVRIELLRNTIFLIDGLDARWIRPLAQATIDAEAQVWRRRLNNADPAAVIADAAELLADGPLGDIELGGQLLLRHPGENPTTLMMLARYGLALVQVPPHGLWAGSTTPTYRLLDDWIGAGEPELVGDAAREELIRLYLRGYGPATLNAIEAWSGLSGLAPLVEKMERDWELIRLDGPGGRELFDLDGLGLAHPDTPAPVRLLAPDDHVIVAQGDGDRIAAADFRRTATANGRSPGFVLVDGRLAGRWRIMPSGAVDTELFARLSGTHRDQLDSELDRLARFRCVGGALDSAG